MEMTCLAMLFSFASCLNNPFLFRLLYCRVLTALDICIRICVSVFLRYEDFYYGSFFSFPVKLTFLFSILVYPTVYSRLLLPIELIINTARMVFYVRNILLSLSPFFSDYPIPPGPARSDRKRSKRNGTK
jgi:hypothetical protein